MGTRALSWICDGFIGDALFIGAATRIDRHNANRTFFFVGSFDLAVPPGVLM